MSAPVAVPRSIELTGRGDEERDPVTRGEHGQRVGPDLVGGVAIGGDPVRTDDHGVDLTAGHQVAGRHVGDEAVRHACLGELPCRQPRALQVGPRLVDPDVDRATGVVGGLDDTERRAELAARERTGVAVGQDAERAVLREVERLQPERREPAVILGRLEDDRIGLGTHRRGDRVTVLRQLPDRLVGGHHPIDRPAEVDRGGPRAAQDVGRATERRAAGVGSGAGVGLGRQGHAQGRDLPDGRRAADDHLADRIADLGRGLRLELLEDVRQLALVDDIQDARTLAERRAEAARRRGRGDAVHLGVRRRVEDRAGGLGGSPLDRLGRPDDRGGAVDDVPRELAEEAPTPEVGTTVRGRWGRVGGRGVGVGVRRVSQWRDGPMRPLST